jgi:S-formylglutathione hydrolase FrmB
MAGGRPGHRCGDLALTSVDFIADVHLTDGPVLWVAWVAGVLGGGWLLWARGRCWVLSVGAALLLSAGVVAAVHWLLMYIFLALPEEVPREVLAWFVAVVFALFLWVLRLWKLRRRSSAPAGKPAWRGAATATAAMLGVFLLGAVQVNAYFGLNHTVSDVLGTAVARIQPLEPGLKRQPGSAGPTPLAAWHAPAGMPDSGLLQKAAIPGSVSGLTTRDAYIYLPPAYQVTPRPALPVLVLFSGQPGGPSDWLTGGALRSRMDRFATEHHGVAPVVVVVDPNGSASANTLCMDSRIAKSDTFLSRDVPQWIEQNLDVDPDHRRWAAGGFSFGATCAMQMGTRHPDIYASVLAFSSEREPALARERRKTIDAAYGGDVAAFDAQTPLNIMQERRFDGHAIYFGAGSRDPEFIGYMGELSGAARSAGFAVEARPVPNAGHSWETASRGLSSALDFMAQRWGIGQ